MNKLTTLYNKILDRPLLALFFILFFSMFLRLIFIDNFGLGFDQIQNLENTHKIIQGDITLIGPRTGPARMFTGPLIYYVSVPFLYFFGEFNTVIFAPAFWALMTGLVIYFATKRYAGTSEALLATTLWAFSPFIVTLDRFYWNPNVTLIATFLIFIPLLKPKKDKLTYILIFLGSFLSFQAHFSGFMLVGLAIFSVIALRRSWLLIIPMICGLTLSLVPAIIFDLRNDFLHWNGFVELFANKRESGKSLLFVNILLNVRILVESTGRLFFFGNNVFTILTAGVLLLTSGLLFIKKHVHLHLAFLWLATIIIAYAFYNGEKPEYYYLIGVPAIIFIIVYLLKKLTTAYLMIFMIFFMVNSLMMTISLFKSNNGMTIGNIGDVYNYLKGRQIRQIVYDVPYGTEFGITYVLNKLPKTETGDVYHVSYGNELKFNGVERFSDLAVWKDPRDSKRNYLMTDSYFLASNLNYVFYKDGYPKNAVQAYESYSVVKNNQVIGQLDIVKQDKEQLPWVQECMRGEKKNLYGSTLKQINGYCVQLTLVNDIPESLELIGVDIF